MSNKIFDCSTSVNKRRQQRIQKKLSIIPYDVILVIITITFHTVENTKKKYAVHSIIDFCAV